MFYYKCFNGLFYSFNLHNNSNLLQVVFLNHFFIVIKKLYGRIFVANSLQISTIIHHIIKSNESVNC